MSKDETSKPISELLALVVHDLRNPVATVSANISFIREVAPPTDPDVAEAIDDINLALSDLIRGLEQLSWIGRWLGGDNAIDAARGSVQASIEIALKKLKRPVTFHPEGPDLVVHGGGTCLAKMVEVLVFNALTHGSNRSIEIKVHDQGDEAWVDILDDGAPLAESLHEAAFTIQGQHALKTRPDGRYSRVAGLLAAKTLAQSMNAILEPGDENGKCRFRVRLKKVSGLAP